jgi:hypothetical protein
MMYQCPAGGSEPASICAEQCGVSIYVQTCPYLRHGSVGVSAQKWSMKRVYENLKLH